MPYKDVYELGCEIRGRAAEHAQRFETLRGHCEHQVKPTPIKDERYSRIPLMAHCALTGNAVRLECCSKNCRALLA